MRLGDEFQTFLFFGKAFYEVRVSGLQSKFQYVSIALNCYCYKIKTNCIKRLTIDPEIY